MLTVSGVRYMTAELGLPQMQKARERIKASVFGLLLLAASWLILNTINPDLLNFNLNIPGVLISGSRPPSTTGVSGVSTGSSDPYSQQPQYQSLRDFACAGKLTCFYSGNYIAFDSNTANDPSVKKWQQECENGYFFSGTVKRAPGELVGRPEATVLVCSY
jgi:hypothetical protein